MIVVVIMSILAAVVIPRMSTSSTDAKESLLRHHLRTVRIQIEVYKAHHFGKPPGNARSQLTSATDVNGNLSPTGLPDAAYPYGPYLKTFPAQPFSGLNSQRLSANLTPTPIAAPGLGWIYHGASGKFWVDHQQYFNW